MNQSASLRRTSAPAIAGIVFVSAVSLTGPLFAQEKSTATIRVASVLPEISAMSQAMLKWGEEVTKRTEGRIQFRYFWTGTLLKSADSAEGIRDGRADGGLTGAVHLPARLPLATIGTIPFMTSNVAAAGHAHAYAYDNIPEFRKEFDEANLHVVGWLPGGVNTVVSKRPVNNMAEMKNLKIRTVGLGADAMEAAEANPISMGVGEVYEALTKGLLEASSGLPLDLTVDFSLHEPAPYVIDTKYGVYTMAFYALNRELYDGLDQETRQIMDEASVKFLDEFYLPEMRAAEKSRCSKAKDDGAQFILWDDGQVKDWKERLGGRAVDRWVASVSDYGADGEKFHAQYEGEMKKLEGQLEWTNWLAACGRGE